MEEKILNELLKRPGMSEQDWELRAVHTKENGKKIRFTMIGQGGSGFAITWENKEVTIDAELTAIKKVKGFLASFEEELTDEEAAAIVAA